GRPERAADAREGDLRAGEEVRRGVPEGPAAPRGDRHHALPGQDRATEGLRSSTRQASGRHAGGLRSPAGSVPGAGSGSSVAVTGGGPAARSRTVPTVLVAASAVANRMTWLSRYMNSSRPTAPAATWYAG